MLTCSPSPAAQLLVKSLQFEDGKMIPASKFFSSGESSSVELSPEEQAQAEEIRASPAAPQRSRRTHVHTHVHTHTDTLTRIHGYTHCMHAPKGRFACKHAPAHTRTLALTHGRACGHMHTRTTLHTHTRTQTHRHARTHTHTQTQTQRHAFSASMCMNYSIF